MANDKVLHFDVTALLEIVGEVAQLLKPICSQPWADSCASTACSNTLKDSWTEDLIRAFSINTLPMSRGSAPFLAKIDALLLRSLLKGPSKKFMVLFVCFSNRDPCVCKVSAHRRLIKQDCRKRLGNPDLKLTNRSCALFDDAGRKCSANRSRASGELTRAALPDKMNNKAAGDFRLNGKQLPGPCNLIRGAL